MENSERLKELMSKNPKDITREELDFIFDNINLQQLIDTVAEQRNKEIINLTNEQKD